MFWQVFPVITDFARLRCCIFSKLNLALCLLGPEFQDSWIAEKTRTNGKIPKVSDFRKFSGVLQIRSHMEYCMPCDESKNRYRSKSVRVRRIERLTSAQPAVKPRD